MPLITEMETYPYTSTTRGATCSMCHTSQKHADDGGLVPVYHLGVFIDMEGAFVICTDCAVDIGRNAGMLLETEAKARKSDVNRAEKRDRALAAAAPSALEARDALIRLVEDMAWE